MKLGIVVYGLSAVAAGIIDIVWGRFESAHQPLQAWGDVPGSHVFAYAVGTLLVAGGLAVLARRTIRFGAIAVGVAYAIFVVFWLPRFVTGPRVLGHHAGIYIGVLGGVCQELIVIAAAVLLCASIAPAGSPSARRWTIAARWIFGISAIVFGLSHVSGVAAAEPMVPPWMPLGPVFWVLFTATAFMLAGIAILSGVADVAAARLLALMLLVFSACTLAPSLAAFPHNQIAWGSNAYNLAAAASVWILASAIAPRRQAMASSLPVSG